MLSPYKLVVNNGMKYIYIAFNNPFIYLNFLLIMRIILLNEH